MKTNNKQTRQRVATGQKKCVVHLNKSDANVKREKKKQQSLLAKMLSIESPKKVTQKERKSSLTESNTANNEKSAHRTREFFFIHRV